MTGPTYELTVRREDGALSVSLHRYRRMSAQLAADINATLSRDNVALIRNPSGSGWVLASGDALSAVDLNETGFASITLTVSR